MLQPLEFLKFDKRTPEMMSVHRRQPEPHHAELICRCVCGYTLTERETTIVASLLVFFPEYILSKNFHHKALELIAGVYSTGGISGEDKIYGCLYLYTLLLLHLKVGHKEEALKLHEQIEEMLSHSQGMKNDGGKKNASANSAKLKQSLIRVLSLILDSPELLLLRENYSITAFPMVDWKLLFENTGLSRDEALKCVNHGEYDRAKQIYDYHRIMQYELPSTLMHHTRLALACDDIEQAKVHLIFAWRMIDVAPQYVKARILYAIILIHMLEKKQFDTWLSALKHAISSKEDTPHWDMELIHTKFAKRLGKWNFGLIKFVLNTMLTGKFLSQPRFVKIWDNVQPIASEQWPEYK